MRFIRGLLQPCGRIARLGALVALILAGCSKPVDTTQRDEDELANDKNLAEFCQAVDQDQPEAAYRCAKALTERYPRNGSAWNKLAYATEGLGKKELVLEYYQKAVTVNPNHAKAWYNLGVTWGNQQELNKEVECYQRALRLRPKYVKAWSNLSIAYDRLNRKSEAAMALKRAIDLDSRFARAIQVLPLAAPGPSVSASGLQFPPIAGLDRPASDFQSFDAGRTEIAAQTNYFTASGETLLGRNLATRPPPSSALDSFPSSPVAAWQRNIPIDLQGQVTNRVFSLDFNFRVVTVPPSYERLLHSTAEEEEATGNEKPRSRVKESAAVRAAKQLNNRGVEQESRVQFAGAIESYRKALEQLKSDPVVWNNLGIALARSDKIEPSIRAFEKVLELLPDSKIAAQNLALAQVDQAGRLIKAGKNADARKLLQEVLRRQPDCIEARCQLIPLLVKENQWEEARPHYEILTEQLPDSVAAWYGLGYAWYRAGKGRSVLNALGKAIALEPKNVEIWLLYALQQVRLGEFKNAAFSLSRCTQLKPENAELWYQLGVVHSKQPSWREAIPALQKSLQLRPGWGLAQRVLAAALAANGQLAEARSVYETVLRRDPSQGALWQELGWVEEGLGDWREAIVSWRKATECNPKDGFVWAGYAHALAEAASDSEACKAYQNAIVAGFANADVWNNLGVSHARLGEYPDALKAFTEALGLQKNDSAMLFNVGIVYYRLGRAQDLKRTLETLRQVDARKVVELTQFIDLDKQSQKASEKKRK